MSFLYFFTGSFLAEYSTHTLYLIICNF